MAEGRFREDLFYRLNVIRIEMPALKERAEDIPLLARYFLGKYTAELDKDIKGFSDEAISFLLDYDYSGNVRELENIIERAVALEHTDSITAGSLPAYITDKASQGVSTSAGKDMGGLPVNLEKIVSRVEVPEGGIDVEHIVSEFERNMIMDALEKAEGVKTKAAELLGLSFRSFRYKLK